MSSAHSASHKRLWDTLKACQHIQGTGWEMLFNDDGSLINTAIHELPDDSCYPHPLLDFYREYAKRLWNNERTAFTPYGATVPVVSNPAVIQIFQEQRVDLPSFTLAGARERYRLSPQELIVGILAAGGPAPGVNTVIDSIVKRHSILATTDGATQREDGSIDHLTFWGQIGGYVGLTQDRKIELNVRITDRASLLGGCILHMSRGETPQQRANARSILIEEAQEQLADEMAQAVARHGLDILYVIGGNGTITAADHVCERLVNMNIVGRRGKPVRVIAAPKTMDNDVAFTDVTFGFRTTVGNAVDVINRLHSEAETCNRIAIVELFGAGSGFVALHASYASGEVDYVLIPEMMSGGPRSSGKQTKAGAKCAKAEADRAAERIADRFRKRGHAVLVVAEGATARFDESLGQFTQGDSAQKTAAFESLVSYIKEQLGDLLAPEAPPQVFTNQPRHLIRSTAPDAADVDLCKQTGKLMVDAALSGMSRCVVSLWHGKFVLVPMKLAAALKHVDVSGYYYLSMMEKYLVR